MMNSCPCSTAEIAYDQTLLNDSDFVLDIHDTDKLNPDATSKSGIFTLAKQHVIIQLVFFIASLTLCLASFYFYRNPERCLYMGNRGADDCLLRHYSYCMALSCFSKPPRLPSWAPQS